MKHLTFEELLENLHKYYTISIEKRYFLTDNLVAVMLAVGGKLYDPPSMWSVGRKLVSSIILCVFES